MIQTTNNLSTGIIIGTVNIIFGALLGSLIGLVISLLLSTLGAIGIWSGSTGGVILFLKIIVFMFTYAWTANLTIFILPSVIIGINIAALMTSAKTILIMGNNQVEPYIYSARQQKSLANLRITTNSLITISPLLATLSMALMLQLAILLMYIPLLKYW